MQPDWQNDAAYEYTKTLNLKGWAWEFLRRNPEYKSDWTGYLKKKAELEKAYGKITSWKTKALEAEPKAWHYEPPKNSGESDAAWRMRCLTSDIEPIRSSIEVGPAKKWGLHKYYDPALPAGSRSKFMPRMKVRIWSHVSDVEGPIFPAERGCFAYIEVDLRRNIKKQLAAAKTRIDELEKTMLQGKVFVKSKEMTKPHIKKFNLYLRVLDAFSATPKPPVKVIAKKFFPKKTKEPGDGEKAVQEVRKQALEWCDKDTGYILLI